jgi:hypothetical protein
MLIKVSKPRGRDIDSEEIMQELHKSKIVVHPGYKKESGVDNDFAVITLEREAGLDQMPICLPNGIRTDFTGEEQTGIQTLRMVWGRVTLCRATHIVRTSTLCCLTK